MPKSYSNILKFSALSLFILAVTAILYAATNWFAAYKTGNKDALNSINEIHQKNTASEDEIIKESQMHYDGRKTASQKSYSCVLKLVLRGIINGGMENAQAVIEDTDKRIQKLYKTGDTVGAGILTKIMKQKVVIHINGKDETLMLSSVACSEDGKDKKVTIARSELDTALKNANSLISQISFKPYAFDDGTGGLLAEDIVPGSLFERAGFKNGDVIREINGTRIENQRRLATIYKGLKLIPFDILSSEDAGAESVKLLLWLDNQAGGVAKEVSKVYQKANAGEGVPVQFVRNGKNQTVILSVE